MQKLTAGDEYEGSYSNFSEMAAILDCGDHTHGILNKDLLEGKNILKTTMHHMFSRQTLFCLNKDGGHIGKWLPILSQVKSTMAL